MEIGLVFGFNQYLTNHSPCQCLLLHSIHAMKSNKKLRLGQYIPTLLSPVHMEVAITIKTRLNSSFGTICLTLSRFDTLCLLLDTICFNLV